MKMKIYFFGKTNEINADEKELLRRINFRFKTELIALPQAGIKDEKKLKTQEAENFLKKIADKSYLIAFDQNGMQMSSEKFSPWLKDKIENNNEIVFVIGGAYGLDEKILERANTKISFSKMVWTRNLFRHMAIEQIYRALEIDGGSNFHK